MQLLTSLSRTGIRGGQEFRTISEHNMRNWAQRSFFTMRQAVAEVLRAGFSRNAMNEISPVSPALSSRASSIAAS